MAEVIGTLIVESIVAATAAEGLVAVAEATYFGISGLSIIGSAAILGATIGLSYATRPDVPKPSDGSVPIKQSVPPRLMGYGTNRLAGAYMLFEIVGNASVDVIAFHSGRVERVKKFYLHDDPMLIDFNGAPVGWGIRYKNVRIGVRLGNDEGTGDAYPNVTGAWTNEHRGKGIASAALYCGGVEAKDFGKVYPRGKPELSVVADCTPIWDPRDDDQDRNDPLTWKSSENPVLQLIDYLTRADGGVGLDFDVLFDDERLAQWMEEADLCDELVPNSSGQPEKRYTSNGWFLFDNKPEDVINNILSTCDGWFGESGGSFALKVGVYREPTVTLEARHFLGAINFRCGQPDESSVNQLDLSFTDPAPGYVEVQPEPFRDEEAISRAGIVRAQQLSLKWVHSFTQTRRLGYRAMQRLNPVVSGSFATTLYGVRALGERWVKVRHPLLALLTGADECVVEIQEGSEVDLASGRCSFNFQVVDPDLIDAYDPQIDEGAAPALPSGPPPSQLSFPLAFDNRNASGYMAALEDI